MGNCNGLFGSKTDASDPDKNSESKKDSHKS